MTEPTEELRDEITVLLDDDIAAALRMSYPHGRSVNSPAITQWKWDRLYIAQALEASNPGFNRERFYEACEPRLPDETPTQYTGGK